MDNFPKISVCTDVYFFAGTQEKIISKMQILKTVIFLSYSLLTLNEIALKVKNLR